MIENKLALLAVPLLPLLGAILAGFFGPTLGRAFAHSVTIFGVAASFVLSVFVFQDVLAGKTFNGALYTWLVTDGIRFEIGFLIDSLTATMMLVVHVRLADGAYLHHRLYERRRWLYAVFCLYLIVYVLDVDVGHVK